MRPLTFALLATALCAVSAQSADRYLVATRTAPRETQLRVLRDDGEARSHAVRTFTSVNAFAATLTDAEVAQLRKSSEVRYVTRTVERHAFDASPAVADRTAMSNLLGQRMPYGIAMVHAPEMWTVTKGAGPINVAVLDTGIDMKHPDLAANYAGGYNVFDQSSNPFDDHGHGTHVAGTIAASDNDIGVVGVAPEVRIWAVKVLDHLGVGTDENIAQGTDWVINKKHQIGGDWIMSLSLGGPIGSNVEQEAFQRVIAEGILVTAAAGNEAIETIEFPAQYDGVIAVGAIDSSTALASFSDFGARLNVVAPGVGVLSTAVEGTAPELSVMTLSTGPTFIAAVVQGSTSGQMRGHYVSCGLGNPNEFPAEVKGNIALIRRGVLTFNEKVRNAQAAGAVSVIIFNYDDSLYGTWTLFRPFCGRGCDDDTHPWPIVLAVSFADGQRLLTDPSQYVDLGTVSGDYTAFNGTSQATPHVAGTLALVWSLDPGAKPSDVKDAVLTTATDLGTPGFDTKYGNGLVNALAAGKKLAPWRFLPQPEPPFLDTPR
jgi:serine protease